MDGDNDNDNYCVTCDRQFYRRYDLERHMRILSRHPSCEWCDRGFMDDEEYQAVRSPSVFTSAHGSYLIVSSIYAGIILAVMSAQKGSNTMMISRRYVECV